MDPFTFIEKLGFPIFVTCYVLFRMDRTLVDIKYTLKRIEEHGILADHTRRDAPGRL